MPAEQPKQQHFVHRAYLEGFIDPDLEREGERYLWVYQAGKRPFPQRPERVARRNYYYCYGSEERREFSVEHGLQQMEDAALPVLRKLNDRRTDISSDDRLTFAGYIALAHVRVPTFERFVNRTSALLNAKLLEMYASNEAALRGIVRKIEMEEGRKIDFEEFRNKLTSGTVIATQDSRQFSLREMFSLSLVAQQIINEMHWTLIVAPEDSTGFLTSDNPVSLYDPTARPPFSGIGFASSPHAHFCFPLSRSVCLVATHNKVGLSVVSGTAHSVRRINTGTLSRADQQAYAPFQSMKVKQLFDQVLRAKGPHTRVLFKKGRAVEE